MKKNWKERLLDGDNSDEVFIEAVDFKLNGPCSLLGHYTCRCSGTYDGIALAFLIDSLEVPVTEGPCDKCGSHTQWQFFNTNALKNGMPLPKKPGYFDHIFGKYPDCEPR